jgi:transcriptional repressor NrdR
MAASAPLDHTLFYGSQVKMNRTRAQIKTQVTLTLSQYFHTFVLMKCPHCQSLDTKVLDTRSQKNGEVTKRRRECEKCEARFSTIETIVVSFPMVVKKDGRREPFSPEKLAGGIKAACQKRPISASRIEQMVEKTTAWVVEHSEKELSTDMIGRFVMNELKDVDEVAYVRFASVYKTFKDISEFVADLGDRNLKQKDLLL